MIFKGKAPTSPEVKHLHEAFGKPEKGTEWTHQQIEELIQETYGNTRYRTITTRWRKQIFRLFGLTIDAIPGMGFRVLEDSETLRFSDKQLRSSSRKLKRASAAALSVDETKLNAEEKKLLDHRVGAYAKLSAYFAKEERRQLPG